MVNKACFRKSVIRDFVSILAIIVGLVVIGIAGLMLNALTPILAPFGTAFNWVLVCYSLILFFSCFLPFTGKPEDLKTTPTVCIIVFGYLFGAAPYISYCIIALREHNFPDIVPVTIGWAALMLICVPISMGYARCRNG